MEDRDRGGGTPTQVNIQIDIVISCCVWSSCGPLCPLRSDFVSILIAVVINSYPFFMYFFVQFTVHSSAELLLYCSINLEV